MNLRLQMKATDFKKTCKPFDAGFHYFFSVNFLPSEGNMAEKVFHKACVAMFNERFSHFFQTFIA
jgi:hypothetical protein